MLRQRHCHVLWLQAKPHRRLNSREEQIKILSYCEDQINIRSCKEQVQSSVLLLYRIRRFRKKTTFGSILSCKEKNQPVVIVGRLRRFQTTTKITIGSTLISCCEI